MGPSFARRLFSQTATDPEGPKPENRKLQALERTSLCFQPKHPKLGLCCLLFKVKHFGVRGTAYFEKWHTHTIQGSLPTMVLIVGGGGADSLTKHHTGPAHTPVPLPTVHHRTNWQCRSLKNHCCCCQGPFQRFLEAVGPKVITFRRESRQIHYKLFPRKIFGEATHLQIGRAHV